MQIPETKGPVDCSLLAGCTDMSIDPDSEAVPAPVAERRIALLEVLDRDDRVRLYVPITAWPISVGRAIDNTLVLDDAAVAPHHLCIDSDPAGVFIEVGNTVNGVRSRGRRFGRGERIVVGDAPLRLSIGDAHLCLRLASHKLAPEQVARTPLGLWQAAWPTFALGAGVLAALLFSAWLSTDPDDWSRTVGPVLLSAFTIGAAWTAGWALISKIFTRRSHFWWHVRVMLLGVLALQALTGITRWLAFALSWPAISDFAFMGVYAIAVTMLYFHAQGLEPKHLIRLRVVAGGLFVGAVGLALWSNHQNNGQFGDELYMTHLFPPAWRIAPTRDTHAFVSGLGALKPILDKQARKPGVGDDATAGSDDDEE